MSSIFTLFINNNNLIQANGITDPETGNYANDASLVFTVLDKVTDTPLTGVSWPVVMNFIVNSDGDYIGSTPSSMPMTKGQRLIIKVEGILVDGSRGEWRLDALANYRNNYNSSSCSSTC